MGFTTAFGQAMAAPVQSMQYRDYAANAQPIAHKEETVDLTTAAVMQDFEKFSNYSGTISYNDLSASEIKAILDEKNNNTPPSKNQQSNADKPLASESELGFVVYPNPSKTSITVNAFFDKETLVNLRIYDLSGQLIENILSNVLMAGEMNSKIDISRYASGRYSIVLEAGGLRSSEALIVSQ